MTDTCPRCQHDNTTLQWLETKMGWVCLPCAVNRQQEQRRIETQWKKKNINWNGDRPSR